MSQHHKDILNIKVVSVPLFPLGPCAAQGTRPGGPDILLSSEICECAWLQQLPVSDLL
jgi:hypothetical protein